MASMVAAMPSPAKVASPLTRRDTTGFLQCVINAGGTCGGAAAEQAAGGGDFLTCPAAFDALEDITQCQTTTTEDCFISK